MFELGKKDGADQDAPLGRPRTEPTASYSASAANRAAAGTPEAAVIGRSIRIDGDLQGEEDLRIEGNVKGTVRLHKNTLTIGREGKIQANVLREVGRRRRRRRRRPVRFRERQHPQERQGARQT